jgi:hypothetical protein
MKTNSVERFINQENLRNFRKRLEAPVNDTQRQMLLALLAEEEAKAEQFARQARTERR